MTQSIGLDFGTTNSVISVCDTNGNIKTATFPWPSGSSQVFRTVLCFWQEGQRLQTAAGQAAIDTYLQDTADSRFIQSIKTYLGTATFQETRLFGVRYQLEDIIALFLRHLWASAVPVLGLNPDPATYRVVAGRPVKFAGADPDDELATRRLQTAYELAGFRNVTFAYEPEGAAFWFSQRIQTRTLLLVADFGGGTSDFSLVAIEPNGEKMTLRPIDHTGIGIAGDVLDYRLIDHVVAPHLGKGSQYFSSGKWFDMPIGTYKSFAAWHKLSMMKTPKLLADLRSIARTSNAPEQIMNLHQIIEHELGYRLYRAVGETKAALSSSPTTTLRFQADKIDITQQVTRDNFNQWINDDIQKIRDTVITFLAKHNLKPKAVDHVFMTGGTSYVPAIQTMMRDIFGPEKMAAGDEFTSVSAGLSLLGRRSGRS